MSINYSLSNIAVICVDAGRDRNGNPRRGYMLVDSATGATVAYQDEGCYGSRSLVDVVAQFRLDAGLAADNVASELYHRRSECIRIAPSYRTHLLRNENRDRIDAQIHGKPTLTY